jgi:altronate dehydratase small subunit
MTVNKPKLVVMNAKDIVATAIENLAKGSRVNVNYQERTVEIDLLSDISFGHKVALRDINTGEYIIKYGESIGIATRPIAKGGHVHTQNVESCRGRGDKKQ